MKTNKKPICIIPARIGSKRIKFKNIKNFYGKPLIYYSIIEAKKSKLFSRIVVTTDSKKIANIAKKYGAEVPFLRSKKLSNDKVGIKPVICDCIKKLKSNNVKYHFIIYATNPLIKASNLKKAFKKINKLKYKILIGVKKFDINPTKSIKIKKNKLVFSFSKKILGNSQNFDNFYYDDGSFAILDTKSYLKRKNWISKKTTYHIHKENESFDLNTKEDLNKLKKIYKLRFKPNN